MTTTIEIRPDTIFKGAGAANGAPFWTFSGTWECKNDEITWTYKESSRPIPDGAKIDTDNLISVDAERMVLKSKLTGAEHIVKRIH